MTATDTTPQLTEAQHQALRLLADHWDALRQRHCRHDACRALVGGLLRARMPSETVTALVETLCELAHDEEADKRVALVADTEAKLNDDGKVSGWPRLITLLGEEGEAVASKVQELLGIESKTIVATYDYRDEAGCLRQFAEGLHECCDRFRRHSGLRRTT